MKKMYGFIKKGVKKVLSFMIPIEFRSVWDFLSERVSYTVRDGDMKLTFELDEDDEDFIIVSKVEKKGRFQVITRVRSDDEDELKDRVRQNLGVDVEFCDICGKPYLKGYTSIFGDFHSCEGCLDTYMDLLYPNGWRHIAREGRNHFLCCDAKGRCFDPGIYRNDMPVQRA